MREEIARLESNKSLVKPISPPHTARARDTVGYSVELQMNLREDFTITEKALTRTV